ncbi:hypothetical protein V8F20_001893 [Naviculisporaceae sp. PSN 640]
MTTPTEFHYFPVLPPELQEMVWEAAMRDDVPGFHAFTFQRYRPRTANSLPDPSVAGVILGHSDEKARGTWGREPGDHRVRRSGNQEKGNQERGNQEREPRDHRVKAIIRPPPHIKPDGSVCVRDRGFWRRPTNRSLHLDDGGLWAACNTSARVMDKHHERLIRRNQSQMSRDIAVSGYFPAGTGGDIPFHIY